MDLSVLVFAEPERPFGPRQPCVAAAGRGRNGRDHGAARRIHLVNFVARDLVEVTAVVSGARFGTYGKRAARLAAVGIERLHAIAGSEPHVLAVERDAADLL